MTTMHRKHFLMKIKQDRFEILLQHFPLVAALVLPGLGEGVFSHSVMLSITFLNCHSLKNNS